MTDQAVSYACIHRMLDDSVDLASRYHDRLAGADDCGVGDLLPDQRLRRMADRLNATTRLSELIVWALYQKSVATGEIDAGEAMQRMPSLCHPDEPLEPVDLHSTEVLALFDDVSRLYARMIRLDGMIRSCAANAG